MYLMMLSFMLPCFVVQLPIIPIGTALSFLLLFVLYAAFVTDLHRQCSAPLHGYAIVSLILFIYAPNHRYIKYHLFHYSRERDGPNRPRSVRVYDQAFQTICILYVYFGMTLIQTCVDDTTTVPIDSGNMGKSSGDGSGAGSAMASAVGLGVQPQQWNPKGCVEELVPSVERIWPKHLPQQGQAAACLGWIALW